LFGYLRPVEPELKIKDFHYFRAYYCGLCRAMGKRLGQLSRFTLSWEATFLALLLADLTCEEEELIPGRCLLHPGRKRLFRVRTPILDYAADVGALLVYYKLIDDWHNERSVKGLIGAGIFFGAKVKAGHQSRELALKVAWELDNLALLEKASCPSLDRAAEPFARLMRTLFSVPDAPRELLNFAYELGRWLYSVDAFDDLEADLKSGSYNPLRYQFGWEGEDAGAFKAKVRPEVEFNLYYTLGQIQDHYRRLKLKRRDVLDNIVITGLNQTTARILSGEKIRGKVSEPI
jgi:hypothetical protein